MDNNIDLLGFPIEDAIKKLEKIGINYDIIETKSFKMKKDTEGFVPVAYVVKQEWTADKQLLLMITTKYRKEV